MRVLVENRSAEEVGKKKSKKRKRKSAVEEKWRAKKKELTRPKSLGEKNILTLDF